LNMISYMGWPITWPNGDLFGTICILDSKENRYDETHSQLLYQFKELIEFSLRSLYEEQLLSSSRLVSQQLDRERRALKKLATTDSLTGIFNRRAFLGLGNQLFVRHHEEQTSIALFVVDVDRFKAINDRHGHLTGDRALAHLAALLVRLSRRVDVLARFGGDEFILLVPEATPGDAAGFADNHPVDPVHRYLRRGPRYAEPASGDSTCGQRFVQSEGARTGPFRSLEARPGPVKPIGHRQRLSQPESGSSNGLTAWGGPAASA
jgi:GGDEF domain-containing protein